MRFGNPHVNIYLGLASMKSLLEIWSGATGIAAVLALAEPTELAATTAKYGSKMAPAMNNQRAQPSIATARKIQATRISIATVYWTNLVFRSTSGE